MSISSNKSTVISDSKIIIGSAELPSIKIDKTEEKKNLLINRVELRFRIDHFGASTPNRLDVKKKIAALQSSNEKLTIIKHLSTYFG